MFDRRLLCAAFFSACFSASLFSIDTLLGEHPAASMSALPPQTHAGHNYDASSAEPAHILLLSQADFERLFARPANGENPINGEDSEDSGIIRDALLSESAQNPDNKSAQEEALFKAQSAQNETPLTTLPWPDSFLSNEPLPPLLEGAFALLEKEHQPDLKNSKA